MKIAIPLVNGVLSSHFGHCECFAIINKDPAGKVFLSNEEVMPPLHEPELYPSWLANRGVTHVIAGGMGENAINLFLQYNIEVVAGVPGETPEKIAKKFQKHSHISQKNHWMP